ncbi:hypothetical protein ACJX0J_040585, partial [Zea mays]
LSWCFYLLLKDSLDAIELTPLCNPLLSTLSDDFQHMFLASIIKLWLARDVVVVKDASDDEEVTLSLFIIRLMGVHFQPSPVGYPVFRSCTGEEKNMKKHLTTFLSLLSHVFDMPTAVAAIHKNKILRANEERYLIDEEHR